MLPSYFGDLCELVQQLADLEEALPPSAGQYALHALLHRFDALIDLIAELALLDECSPANDVEGPQGP